MLPLSGDLDDAKGIINEKLESNSILRGSSTLKTWFCTYAKKWSCNGCYNC